MQPKKKETILNIHKAVSLFTSALLIGTSAWMLSSADDISRRSATEKRDPWPAPKIIIVENYNGCDKAEFIDNFGGDGKLDMVLCTYKGEGVVAITPNSTDGTRWSDWENKFNDLVGMQK